MKKSVITTIAISIMCYMFFVPKKTTSQINNCGFFCVNNIYFDSTNTLMVSIQYAGGSFINYPYVSAIYDINGAPVASGSMFYFGQLPNTTQDYPVNTSLAPPLPQNFAAVVIFNYDTLVCQLPYPTSCTTNSSSHNLDNKFFLKVSPNPVHNTLNIDFFKNENISVRVLNTSGQIASTFYLNEKDKKIECSEWTAGIYILEFYQNGNLIQREKLIKY